MSEEKRIITENNLFEYLDSRIGEVADAQFLKEGLSYSDEYAILSSIRKLIKDLLNEHTIGVRDELDGSYTCYLWCGMIEKGMNLGNFLVKKDAKDFADLKAKERGIRMYKG